MLGQRQWQMRGRSWRRRGAGRVGSVLVDVSMGSAGSASVDAPAQVGSGVTGEASAAPGLTSVGAGP
eukprot:7568612-Lingulodinium_polyedra.AAC.1